MRIQKKSSLIGLGMVYFFLQLQFWFPIWVIFLLDKGLTLEEIIYADIIYNVCIIVFEFPLGYIGDRLGRKKTFFLGAMFGGITYCLMTLISNFSWLLICWISWSAFMATISGTDTSYIYELIVREKQEEKANHIFGYFAAIASLAFVVSHFTAGFMYSFNINLPIFLNAGCSFLAAMGVLFLPDPKQVTVAYPKIKEIVYENAWKKKVVRFGILVLAVVIMYHWTMTLLFQPYILELGITVANFGYIYMAFTGMGILSGLFTGKIVELVGKYKTIIFGMILLVTAIGLTGFIPGLAGLVGVILIKFAFYFCDTPIKVIINNQIENRLRASIFSVANLFACLMLACSRPLVGFIATNSSNRFAFQIWFYVGLVFIPIVFAAIIFIQKLELTQKEGEKQEASKEDIMSV